MEQIILDFEKNGIQAYNRLDSILFSSGWNHLPFTQELSDMETKLLFPLVSSNLLRIFEHCYAPNHDHSAEVLRKADYLAALLHKRNRSQSLCDLQEIFAKYEPDLTQPRIRCNALFYPELKAYIRCGDLFPQKLFELLEDEDCETIILFPDTCFSDTESAYYTIECTLPKKKLFEVLEKMKIEALTEAANAIEQANLYSNIIPTLTGESSGME